MGDGKNRLQAGTLNTRFQPCRFSPTGLSACPRFRDHQIQYRRRV